MKKIIVDVDWSGKNFSAGFGMEGVGAVMATASTYPDIRIKFAEALKEHVEVMLEDGDELPGWMVAGDYELEFRLTTAALLQSLGADVSLSAVSRATGINQRLLSHYANGIKVPREQQRMRIIDGLHSIGRRLMAV